MALVPRARQKSRARWPAGGVAEEQTAPQPLARDRVTEQKVDALTPELCYPTPAGEVTREDASRREDVTLVRDFDALMARYEKPLFNVIFQWIGDYDEAHDLTVETFVSAWKARDRFRGDARVYTWLYKIAHNHFLNRLKQRGRQREMEGLSLDAAFGSESGGDEGAAAREVADWSFSPALVLEQKELRALIDRAVDSLASEYKVVLTLRELEGLSYNEIAQVTGLSLEAVKTRLNRARAMVRQRVEPYLRI